MMHGLLSLKNRNGSGNIAIGLCLIGLCVARLFLGHDSALALIAAVCLLLLSSVSLVACISPRREMADEMSAAHDGQAAGHALRITLIVVGALCAISMATGMQMDFVTTGLGLLGLGLLIYGVVFGWLERQ